MQKWVTTEEYLSWAEWEREAPPWVGGTGPWRNRQMGDVGVVARRRRWEMGHDGGGFGFGFPPRRRWEMWVTTARSRRCTRRRPRRCSPVMMVLIWRGRLRHFSGFRFLLWERDRAEGEGEMRKKKYWWEKWHAGNKTEEADTVTVVGSMNSVKNIEW